MRVILSRLPGIALVLAATFGLVLQTTSFANPPAVTRPEPKPKPKPKPAPKPAPAPAPAPKPAPKPVLPKTESPKPKTETPKPKTEAPKEKDAEKSKTASDPTKKDEKSSSKSGPVSVTTNKPDPAKVKREQIRKAGNHNLKGRELGELIDVYSTLASGNHDYDGHRVKAMGHVGTLARHMDSKSAPVLQKIWDASLDAGTIHEPQPVSDAALRRAEASLVTLRAEFVKNKQTIHIGHTDRAIGEIQTALKIR